MTEYYRFSEINRALCVRAEELAVRLFGPPSRRYAKTWKWEKGVKLELTTKGKYRGWYRDWRAQRSYTPIGAIGLARGLAYSLAADWAVTEFLGWSDLANCSAEEKASRAKAFAEAELEWTRLQSELDARDAEDEAHRIREAMETWRRSVPLVGTPAELYLISRGIFAETWPETLRWHAAEQALLALSTSPEGEPTAFQEIRLDAAGIPLLGANGKKIKLTRGVLRQGSVKFGGLSDGPLVLCEGVETGLSVWLATGYETWAGLGLISQISLEAVPHDRVVIACPDDDPRGHPTLQAAKKAIGKWRREGRQVLQATPFEALMRDKGDFNDALQKFGRTYVAERLSRVLQPSVSAIVGARDVGEARAELSAAIERAIDRLTEEALRVNSGLLEVDETSQFGVKVSVGAGKTREAIAAVARAISRMRNEGAGGKAVVYSVPTHRLGEELEGRLKDEAFRQGISLQVKTWRGREAKDPATGSPMCANLEAVNAAESATLDPQEVVCKSKRHHCRFFGTCAYQRQREARADVWLVPHASLFHRRPEAIGDPALLIIDESIWQSSVHGCGEHPVSVGFGALERGPTVLKKNSVGDLVMDPAGSADLKDARDRLLLALRAWDPKERCALPVAELRRSGITAEMCRTARGLEWDRRSKGDLRPGIEPAVFLEGAQKLASKQGDIRVLSTMWRLLAEALEADEETVGRVTFAMVDRGHHKALTLRWAKPIAKGWLAPTLHIDATLRPSLVRHLLPRFELLADIQVATPNQRVTAVVGKTFSHRSLSDERSVRKIWAAVRGRACLTAGDTLVVMPLAAEDIIRAKERFPAHVHLGHHNSLAGLDQYGDVGRIIILGRTQPSPSAVSDIYAAMTGSPAPGTGTVDGWYSVSLVTVIAKDGSANTFNQDRHPQELAEDIRAAICEDQLIQVIGRGRGVNRTADTPLEIELWSDAEPPVEVDSIRQFEHPSRDEEALAAGVWLESAADLAKMMPALGTEAAIRADRKRTGSNSNIYSNWKVTPSSENILQAAYASNDIPHLSKGYYQRQSQGCKPKAVVWDGRVIKDIWSALTDRVGQLASFIFPRVGSFLFRREGDHVHIYMLATDAEAEGEGEEPTLI